MIAVTAQKYCKEHVSNIENYEKALADKIRVWPCHHRLELTLDGQPGCRKADLIRHGMYYNRPAFELIFLSPMEHSLLHLGKEHRGW